jgi:hypothetical protein
MVGIIGQSIHGWHTNFEEALAKRKKVAELSVKYFKLLAK